MFSSLLLVTGCDEASSGDEVGKGKLGPILQPTLPDNLATDCEGGTDPSGVNVFFDVDLSAPTRDDSIVPIACNPDPGGILSTYCGQ